MYKDDQRPIFCNLHIRQVRTNRRQTDTDHLTLMFSNQALKPDINIQTPDIKNQTLIFNVQTLGYKHQLSKM